MSISTSFPRHETLRNESLLQTVVSSCVEVLAWGHSFTQHLSNPDPVKLQHCIPIPIYNQLLVVTNSTHPKLYYQLLSPILLIRPRSSVGARELLILAVLLHRSHNLLMPSSLVFLHGIPSSLGNHNI